MFIEFIMTYLMKLFCTICDIYIESDFVSSMCNTKFLLLKQNTMIGY